MKKINKNLYNRLYIEAQELKMLGKVKLANSILNSLGSVSEEELKESSDEDFIEKDIFENTKQDLTEIVIQLCSDLNCNISSKDIDLIASKLTDVLITKIENLKD